MLITRWLLVQASIHFAELAVVVASAVAARKQHAAAERRYTYTHTLTHRLTAAVEKAGTHSRAPKGLGRTEMYEIGLQNYTTQPQQKDTASFQSFPLRIIRKAATACSQIAQISKRTIQTENTHRGPRSEHNGEVEGEGRRLHQTAGGVTTWRALCS